MRLISLTCLISAEEKKNVKMRRLGRLVRLISLTSLISAEENEKKCNMRRLWRLAII